MSNKNQLIAFIQNVVPIPTREAEGIANQFEYEEFKANDYLLREDQIGDRYFYLSNGLMRRYLYDTRGNEITTDFFVENSIVFEVTSFFNRVRSETNIQAITDCNGFSITYQELNTLFHEKPAFRDFGRAILVKEFIASQQRNYSMINKSSSERYQNLLKTNPEILKHSPLKYIASYLGINDSTLSRLRRKISD